MIEGKVWTEVNDELLMEYAGKFKCDWKKVAKKFNNRKITPHFLKLRYKELNNKSVRRKLKFTDKEDLLIAKYYNKLGSNWD